MLHPPTKEQKEILRALESSNVSIRFIPASTLFDEKKDFIFSNVSFVLI